MVGAEADQGRHGLPQSAQCLYLAGGCGAGDGAGSGLLAAGLAKVVAGLGASPQSAADELAGRTELLLGDRSSRVFDGCVVCRSTSFPNIAAALVRACGVVFWCRAPHGLSGSQIYGTFSGRGEDVLAPPRAGGGSEALAETECVEDV